MLALLGLIERVPRIVRFAAVGGFCTLLQLTILAVLAEGGMWAHAANVIGYVVSTQVNAILSTFITWSERRDPAHPVSLRRLLAFNTMALATLGVNEAVFALAHQSLHYLPSAIIGTLASASVNYAVSNRLVFHLA